MSKVLVKALATASRSKDSNTEECLIEGMTPYTYMRYQKKLKEARNGTAARVQSISANINK